MKRYIKIFLTILRLNYVRTINHRGEFYSGLFGSLAWGFFSIVMIAVLTSNSNIIFGWTRGELFVLTGVFNIIVGGFFRMMNAENFDRMTSKISHGDLDEILLKPIDSQFLISFLHIKLHGLFRIFLAILFTAYILSIYNIFVGALNIILFLMFALFGYIIIYSFWYLVMTFAIWFPDLHNLNEITYNTDALTRMPPQVLFAIGIPILLILLPYIFVVSTPTKALIGNLGILEGITAIFVSILLLLLSRAFWKFALRYYTSASG